MLRRAIWALVLLAVAGGVAWSLWPRPITVETATVGRRDIVEMVEEEGKSRIRDIFTVSAPIAGQMLRVNLHAGDAVVKDETVVASIKPADPALLDARTRRVAEAAVEAARAAVELAKAELRQAEAQLVFVKSELARAGRLIAQGTISERAYEKAKLDAETAEAVVESARSLLKVRIREQERAQAALIETGGSGGACCTEVRAPISGKVLRVLTESEQVVQAGTPLLQIGDPADLEIVAELLSRDAVLVRPGAEAVIDNWGGPPVSASVARIEPSAVTKVSALGIEEQRVNVVLSLDSEDGARPALGDGFRVVARITVARGEQLLAVPIGALFRDGGAWAVYALADGRARLKTVEIGRRNDQWAEVTSGLNEGETVILHPSDRIADGVLAVASRGD